MSIYAHVSRSPAQALPFPVRNMLLRLGIPVLLGHAKIDHENGIGRLRRRSADEEVVRLDVPVNQVLLVYRLYTRELFEQDIAN